MNILLIEAEGPRRATRQYLLQREGYSVDAVPSLAAAGLQLSRRRYDFALLAQPQPDGDALAWLRAATRHGHHTAAFVLLTGTNSVEQRLQGFAAGADDCLAPTVAPVELACRLRSLARQRRERPRPCIRFGAGFELDMAARLLRHGPCAVPVSRAQFDLLHHLLRHRGKPLTRQQLGAELGNGKEASNYIDVHVKNLRKALARHAPPDFLQTVRGIGYRAA